MERFSITAVEIGQIIEIAGQEYEFGPRGAYSFNLFLSWYGLHQIFPETWGEIILRDPGTLEEKYWFNPQEIYLALLLGKISRKLNLMSLHSIEIGGLSFELEALMQELAGLIGKNHPLVSAYRDSSTTLREGVGSFFGGFGFDIILALLQGEGLPEFKRFKRD